MKTMKNLWDAWKEIRTDRAAMDMVYGVISLTLFTFGLWVWMWIASWMAL